MLDKQSVYFIAEAGVNHNGSILHAIDLCSLARDCGADAVKFQTWKTEKLIEKNTRQAEYQKKNSKFEVSQYQMLKELELSYRDFEKLKDHCDLIGIDFLSTPDEEESLNFLVDILGLKTIKVGSGELGNIPFLREVAKLSKRILLSTGMHNFEDIENSVKAIREISNSELVLMQCTSSYPCPDESAHLRVIPFFEEKFKCLVGFSDHTLGITAGLVAVSLGACVIEKHFTNDKSQIGPDHSTSLNPKELTNLISNIRRVSFLLGDPSKKIQECEKDNKNVVTKIIIATKDIKVGDKLDFENIALKRSGKKGLSGIYWDKLFNTKSTLNFMKGDAIICKF